MPSESDFSRYKQYLVNNLDSYLAYKSDELREHLERVAARYCQAIWADVRRYCDQLVREYQDELRGK